MKVINQTSVQSAVETLNEMAISKVVDSDYARCPMCMVSDG